MGFGSFEKILQVLDILEDATTGLSFDEIYAKLDAPRSTLYRYLKALTSAGLIASLPNTGYTLGPRIAELDYKMRTQDLLVVVSKPLMSELVQTTPAVALLCRLYRNSVPLGASASRAPVAAAAAGRRVARDPGLYAAADDCQTV